MKIKTLTTYNVYNYGASLQAYALMTYLSQLGHDVEIINYQPEYLTRKYNYKWVNPESKMSRYALTRVVYRILKFLQRQTTLANKRLFDNFTHHMLHETTQLYHTFDELQKIHRKPMCILWAVTRYGIYFTKLVEIRYFIWSLSIQENAYHMRLVSLISISMKRIVNA